MRHLSGSQGRLLREAIINQDPDLLPLVEAVSTRYLTGDERFELQRALAQEFAETGTDRVGEPTDRGLLLEELIDRIGARTPSPD